MDSYIWASPGDIHRPAEDYVAKWEAPESLQAQTNALWNQENLDWSGHEGLEESKG